MEYKIIDMSQYKRIDHFNYFRALPNPFVGVTVNADVTDLVKFCKETGYSFFLSFLRAAALAANSVPEFRQRIRGDSIVEYKSCGTSHIELLPDDTYSYCTLYHDMPYIDYLCSAEERRTLAREKRDISEDEDVEGLYFITSLPWLNYTSFIQPTGSSDESNPRISWGKYCSTPEGKYIMPVTVLANHAIVDGIHISRFFQNLDMEMQNIICR